MSMDENEIKELNHRLDRIEKMLSNDILHDCKKMSHHIDFVERIYEYIKFPLFYITNKFRYLSSKETIPIEHVTHQTESTDET